MPRVSGGHGPRSQAGRKVAGYFCRRASRRAMTKSNQAAGESRAAGAGAGGAPGAAGSAGAAGALVLAAAITRATAGEGASSRGNSGFRLDAGISARRLFSFISSSWTGRDAPGPRQGSSGARVSSGCRKEGGLSRGQYEKRGTYLVTRSPLSRFFSRLRTPMPKYFFLSNEINGRA